MTKRPKILIVEDDSNIAKLVKYNLEKAGFDCEIAVTGEDAFDVIDRRPIDLIVLDIMLPKMDGLEFCKVIRQNKQHAALPVLMLTAKGEEVDRIVGFELGADDYMVKPFSPRELVLRIKAILRRNEKQEKPSKEVFAIGGIQLDLPRRRVTVFNKDIKLTAMEFNLLQLFMQRQGRVQSREQLLEDVWQINPDVTTRTVDTHIKRLRQKLGKAGRLIETIRGHGYRLNDED